MSQGVGFSGKGQFVRAHVFKLVAFGFGFRVLRALLFGAGQLRDGCS